MGFQAVNMDTERATSSTDVHVASNGQQTNDMTPKVDFFSFINNGLPTPKPAGVPDSNIKFAEESPQKETVATLVAEKKNEVKTPPNPTRKRKECGRGSKTAGIESSEMAFQNEVTECDLSLPTLEKPRRVNAAAKKVSKSPPEKPRDQAIQLRDKNRKRRTNRSFDVANINEAITAATWKVAVTEQLHAEAEAAQLASETKASACQRNLDAAREELRMLQNRGALTSTQHIEKKPRTNNLIKACP